MREFCYLKCLRRPGNATVYGYVVHTYLPTSPNQTGAASWRNMDTVDI